jgi:hypothetical protein
MLDSSEAINLMGNSQQRVAQQHAWAGIFHDFFGLGFTSRFVAVNGAIAACRLVFPIRTFLEPHFNIVQKAPTLCAQNATGSVMVIRTKDANHLCDG